MHLLRLSIATSSWFLAFCAGLSSGYCSVFFIRKKFHSACAGCMHTFCSWFINAKVVYYDLAHIFTHRLYTACYAFLWYAWNGWNSRNCLRCIFFYSELALFKRFLVHETLFSCCFGRFQKKNKRSNSTGREPSIIIIFETKPKPIDWIFNEWN